MDSALRPREIQSRIRAGQSLEEVARLSGESAERIERFAAPVLAEREHVAGLALASSVRRRGELGGHRSLRVVVREQLLAHRVDPDTVAWDAWRNEDRRWTVQALWTQDDAERIARFQFDLGSRYSVANDAESRWLIAEDEDSFERDELALVNAVTGDATPAGSASRTRQVDPDEEPTISLADVPLRFAPEPLKFTPEPRKPRRSPEARQSPEPRISSGSREKDSTARTEPEEGGVETEDWFPRSAGTPQEIREELEAEIDAYGVVPEGRSELDVLYDMLSGIAEDSINIYAGLNDPVVSDTEPDRESSEPVVQEPVPQTMDLESQPTELRVPAASGAPEAEAGPASPEAPAPEPDARGTELAAPIATGASTAVEPTAAPPVEPPSALPAQPAPAHLSAATGSAISATTPDDQQPLVDNEPTVQVAPGAAKRRGSRKKRASVPSWDEIMFGGPKPE